ncbi:MAG: radical SAM protein [Thermodesulfobacteriota bacterium]|nr:radical SAM protein [Thermodesulfobacteriota bacterium]
MKKTVAFSKNAINVFFHILTNCNLKCKHCYINKKQHGENTLPLETIEAWLKVFASKTKNANVIFLGGEPTLHPDLSLAIKKAKALGYDSITVDTNGYLFHVFIQVIGIRGKSAENSHEKLQVSRNDWLEIIPDAAQKIARLGITVTYPKVFLSPDEPFECAAKVAENYFIFPNGRVYQCPLCEDFPLHSKVFKGNLLLDTPKINESNLFNLNIPEGCVMNKLIQPGNLSYNRNGTPEYRVACCMLKEEIKGN